LPDWPFLRRRTDVLRFFSKVRAASLVAITVLSFVIIGLLAPGYFSLTTVRTIVLSGLMLTSVTIGVMGVILTRNIDVSVGSTLALSAAILGLLLKHGQPLPLAIIAAVLSGSACGLVNGLLVSVVRVPSIIATLGTLGLFRGVMLLLTGGLWLEDLPADLKHLATPVVFGLPSVAFVVLAIAVAAFLFLNFTRLGRYVYAVGDNAAAAVHIGLPAQRITIGAFVASGALAGVAGVIFAAQIGFIPTNAGNGIELRAIAACVLGGVSLLGGSGGVAGVLAAVFFLTSVDSALIYLKIPGYWNDLLAGVMLLVILLIDGRLRSLLDNAIRSRRYEAKRHGVVEVRPEASNLQRIDVVGSQPGRANS
jgi:AI-2 transport system permease protein